VLTELGFGAKEIDGLRAGGVIPGQIEEAAKKRRPA